MGILVVLGIMCKLGPQVWVFGMIENRKLVFI